MSTGRIPLEAALVRVWRAGTPLGAGFLAGPREVLTAAHVVADVLGAPADGSLPAGQVQVDFPLLAPDRMVPAEVVAWAPVDEMLRGDVAGLRLLEPPPAGAAPLVLIRSAGLSSEQLIMVGFPRGLELGSWVYGRRGGPVATGWVEIHSEPGRESTLDPGFSGSPVWTPELDATIGMVARRVRGAPPKIGYMITVDSMLSAWPELAAVIERRPPFRALRPFAEEDAALFFGRGEQATQLARLVRATPVVCVVGPSGVGKSSLLHAGVFPLLRAETGQVVTVLRPSDGSSPTHALASALDRLINPNSPAHERLARLDGLVTRLADGGVTDIVAAALDRQDGDRLLVAVDQFEEIFDGTASEQAAFTRVLRAASRPGARWSVLLNMRDTFLGAALSNPATIELAAGWLPVTVADLTASQLREAITGPLARVGTVSVAPGLVERLLDDVQSAPSSLPLLQFTLTELWARRRDGLLPHDAYDDLGGVRGALAGYARDVWTGLDPRAQNDAVRLLAQLIRPVPDSELWVRRTAHRDELDDVQWAIAQRLASTRLLVLRGAPRPGVELAHESLLAHWQRLRELADEYRDFRLWQENLRQRMATWREEKLAPRRLLSGFDLREANRWTARRPADFSAAELGFLTLSRQRRRRRLSATALALAVILIAAFTTYRSAEEQRADLAATDLAAKSVALEQYDSYGAMQLALRAYRTNPDVTFPQPEPRTYPGADRLLPDYTMVEDDNSKPTPSTSAGPGGLEEVRQYAMVMSGKISGDGTRMVTTNSARHVVVWTVDGDRVRSAPLSDLFNDEDYATQVVISRSGRYVAFLQTMGPVIPDDVNAPADENGLPVINPDDYRTCTPTHIADILTCLVVYDIEAGAVTTAVRLGDGLAVASMISIDPDDKVVAAALPDNSINRMSVESSQNTVRRWDLRTGQEWAPLRLPWRSWLAGLWLRPGGTAAVVREFIPGPTGTLPERLALSVVDLGSEPSRRELAANISESEMSLDWRTVAAVENPVDRSSFRLTAWDVESGEVITHIPGLSREQGNGFLGLNRDGTMLALTWLPPLKLPSTNVADLRERSPRLAVWSLPSGAKQKAPDDIDTGWARVIPLGDNINGPLAMTRDSTVGLTLVKPGQAPPLRRMADAVRYPNLDNDELAERLCSLLADPNNDKAVEELVPQDSSQEQLCPT